MLEITITNVKDHKKNGELKKNKTPIQVFSGENHDKIIAQATKYLSNLYTDFTSPYFFTHFTATNKVSGDQIVVSERVKLQSGEYLMTTPQELFNNLTK